MAGITNLLPQYLHPDQVLKIDAVAGAPWKLSFNIRAILVPDSMDQVADFADPIKSQIEALVIFELSFNNGLPSPANKKPPTLP